MSGCKRQEGESGAAGCLPGEACTSGRIHSFQSMGAVDGPGLRYVIFMQGCPLRCIYCHNPDTWEFSDGMEMTPEEAAAKVLRCRPYLKNGGVTVTGGEPLCQPDFVAELFRILRAEGIHTALDTSGVGDLTKAREVLRYTDLVLADVKFLTTGDYEVHCRADFSRVTAFLDLTKEMRIPLWIRCVIVPGLNDTAADVLALSDFLRTYPNVEKTELLPFRKLCLEKYESLGIPFPLADTPEMPENRVKRLQEELDSKLLT